MKGDVLLLGYKTGGRVQQPFVLNPSQNTIVCNDLQEKASRREASCNIPIFHRFMVGSELVEWPETFLYVIDNKHFTNSKYKNVKEPTRFS